MPQPRHASARRRAAFALHHLFRRRGGASRAATGFSSTFSFTAVRVRQLYAAAVSRPAGLHRTFSADALRGVAHARLATMNNDAARTSARLPVLTFPSSHSEGGEARVRHNCCPKLPRQRLSVNSVQPPPLTVRTTMAAAAARQSERQCKATNRACGSLRRRLRKLSDVGAALRAQELVVSRAAMVHQSNATRKPHLALHALQLLPRRLCARHQVLRQPWRRVARPQEDDAL